MHRPVAPQVRGLSLLQVRRRLGPPSHARLIAGALSLPCVLGPTGFTSRKREGDGGTPLGRFPVLTGFFRGDRIGRPRSALPLRRTRPDDGWCDDGRSGCYNKPVRLPFPAGHERMWRDDRLYDLGLVIDYNQRHPRKNRGSAIFIHVMAPNGTPTAGCVALRPGDLRRLLPRLRRPCWVVIG